MRNVGTASAGFLRTILLAGSATTALCVPSLAQAQDDDVALPAEEALPADSYGADEDASTGNLIIVTATKRESTLQDTPVAVSVTTAETLERGQIRDLRDLQTVVPSLSVGQRQSVANTNFFIRGFGNGANNVGIEPSVGVFVDNVYRSRTAAQITDLPDVERIEVLRGPQSTLFGKNASAGVISITTQEPRFQTGGSAELTYGSYDQIIAKAHVIGPLSDDVAGSLSGGFNKRDGFFRDLGTGDRTNERNRLFVRGQVLYDAGGGLNVRLIGDYDKIDENCCAVVNMQDGIATAAVRGVGGQVNAPGDAFDGVVYNNANSTNHIENYGISGQVDYEVGPFTLTSITAYRETDAVTFQDSDFTSADLIYPNSQDLDLTTFTQEVRLAGQFGDTLSVLLGAFYIEESVDQSNQLLYGRDFRNYANILVQSLSGCSLSLFGPAVLPPSVCAAPPRSLETTLGALQGDPGLYTGRFFPTGSGFTEAYTLDSKAISLFGQIDFEIARGLVLTVGGNYTDDSKTFTTDLASTDLFSDIDLVATRAALTNVGIAQTVGGILGVPGGIASPAQIADFAALRPDAFDQIRTGAAAATAPILQLQALQYMPQFLDVPNTVEDGKIDDSDFSYTVRLAYDLNSAINLYASYATGFKASSVNLSRDSRPSPADRDAIIAAGLAPNNLTYNGRFAGPEESRVIEAGLKGNWGDFSANVAVFDQQIKGFQSNIFTGSGFALLNAGKLSTFGVEFEGVATIADALTINLGVTYLDPKYDSFAVSSVGDLTGTRPAGIPEWTFLIGAQYEAQVGNGLLIPRVSYLHQTEVQLIEGMPGFLVRNPDGTIASNAAALAAALPFTRQVDDLTASIGYEMENGLSFTVWGRNLLDRRDVGVVFDTPAQPRGISGYANDPRTYGATLRYRF